MKLTLVSSFCIAGAIFVGPSYVAYKGALHLTYRYRESRAFTSLGQEKAQQLRAILATTYALTISHLWTRYEPSSGDYHIAVERNIPALQKLRSTAPELLRSPIDLQLAIDYAELARLQQRVGHMAEADRARQSAQELLKSLGWKDVSQDTLDAMADREIKPLPNLGDKK